MVLVGGGGNASIMHFFQQQLSYFGYTMTTISKTQHLGGSPPVVAAFYTTLVLRERDG